MQDYPYCVTVDVKDCITVERHQRLVNQAFIDGFIAALFDDFEDFYNLSEDERDQLRLHAFERAEILKESIYK